jgi:hypothetical protein
VIRVQDEDSSDIDIGLYHRKANDSMLVKPVGLQLRFTKNTTWFEKIDLHDAPAQLEEKLSIASRMDNYLLGELRATPAIIAKALDITESTARKILSRHKDSRFIKWEDGSGEWSNRSHSG